MPSPSEILAVVRELEPQLPALTGEKATEVHSQISPLIEKEVQSQISPLIEKIEAGQSNGADLLKMLCQYPMLEKELQKRLELPESIDENSLESLLKDRSFQNLPGTPSSAIPGQRYICPVPDCPEDWFRRRVGQSPNICEEHGVVMVPETGEG